MFFGRLLCATFSGEVSSQSIPGAQFRGNLPLEGGGEERIGKGVCVHL